jgi:hypothetical protein
VVLCLGLSNAHLQQAQHDRQMPDLLLVISCSPLPLLAWHRHRLMQGDAACIACRCKGGAASCRHGPCARGAGALTAMAGALCQRHTLASCFLATLSGTAELAGDARPPCSVLLHVVDLCRVLLYAGPCSTRLLCHHTNAMRLALQGARLVMGVMVEDCR